MSKNVSFYIDENLLKITDENSMRYNLSRNSFIQTSIVLTYLNNESDYMTEQDLNYCLYNYISNMKSKITKRFIKEISVFEFGIKKEITKFLWNLNLIKGLKISTVVNANFYKQKTTDCNKHYNNTSQVELNYEYLFYFALRTIKGKDIHSYIKKQNINFEILGAPNHPDNEYIFLSKYQQFQSGNAAYTSNVFDEICRLLNITPCDCIKVHYNELGLLLTTIKAI